MSVTRVPDVSSNASCQSALAEPFSKFEVCHTPTCPSSEAPASKELSCENLTLAMLKDCNKVMVVFFFATNCTPPLSDPMARWYGYDDIATHEISCVCFVNLR